MIKSIKFNRFPKQLAVKNIFSRYHSTMAAAQHCTKPHVCFIVPPHILLDILEHNQVSEDTRVAVQNTINHCGTLKTQRIHKQAHFVAMDLVLKVNLLSQGTCSGNSESEDTSESRNSALITI